MQYNLNLWPKRRNFRVLYDGYSATGQIPSSTERISSFPCFSRGRQNSALIHSIKTPIGSEVASLNEPAAVMRRRNSIVSQEAYDAIASSNNSVGLVLCSSMLTEESCVVFVQKINILCKLAQCYYSNKSLFPTFQSMLCFAISNAWRFNN